MFYAAIEILYSGNLTAGTK